MIGYDAHLVARLAPRDRRFFAVSRALAIVAAVLGGAGAAYGMSFPFGAFGVVVGVGFGAFVLNLVRLVHAGSGYPVHLPIDDIDNWHPAATAGAVLTALGVLLSQPLVVLVLALAHGRSHGLVDGVHAAWSHPIEASALTAAFAMLLSAPGWLRVAGEGSVRAYERERWIDDRIFVDDAFADAQDAITRELIDVPGFKPPLAVHYLDPPYNTKPLLYGLDPSVVVRDQVKWTKPSESVAETVGQASSPAVDKGSRPTERDERTPLATAAETAAPPATPQPSPRAEPDDAVTTPTFDDATHDRDTTPPKPAYFDMARVQAKRARENLDVVVPFITELTGRPEAEVRGLLRAAPDEMRMHQLFTDWKSLRTILLKDAGFALDKSLAPILSIIVQKPVDDVERRLRAAPREKRLTGVFAPELARRLLKKKSR